MKHSAKHGFSVHCAMTHHQLPISDDLIYQNNIFDINISYCIVKKYCLFSIYLNIKKYFNIFHIFTIFATASSLHCATRKKDYKCD